jgi:hypothetical protein
MYLQNIFYIDLQYFIKSNVMPKYGPSIHNFDSCKNELIQNRLSKRFYYRYHLLD